MIRRPHDVEFYAWGHLLRSPDESSAVLLHEEIFVKRIYEFPVRIDHPRMIVDCGANVGTAMSYFCQAYPDAHVLCIEPDPLSFSYLKHNVERNHLQNRTTLLNVAVADSHGTRPFYASPVSQYSLRMSLDRDRMGGVGVPTPVTVERLSQIVPLETDILKLDVEGAEFSIVNDLQEEDLLPSALAVEVHHNPVLRGRLPQLLGTLEEAGLNCTLDANPKPGFPGDPYQDIMVWAQRYPK